MNFTNINNYNYSSLKTDLIDALKAAGIFLIGSYMLSTELDAQSRTPLQHNRITKDTSTAFIPGRSIAVPDRVTVIPGREAKELNYGSTYPNAPHGQWVLMTPEGLINYEKRNIAALKKKNPNDKVIIADERALAQWRKDLADSTQMGRMPRDTTLLKDISTHLGNNNYDGRETAADALTVGRAGHRGLQFGAIRRTPAYTDTIVQNGRTVIKRYDGEEVKFMLYIPGVTDSTALIASGLTDSSAVSNRTSGNSTARTDTTDVPDTTKSKWYAGLLFGKDGSSTNKGNVTGLTLGYSPDSHWDLEGTVAKTNLIGNSNKDYDSTWNSTFGSTVQKFTEKYTGWKTRVMAWLGGNNLKVGVGAQYNSSNSTLESTVTETIRDRAQNNPLSKPPVTQPTTEGSNSYFSIPVGLRLGGIKGIDGLYLDVTGDINPNDGTKNGVNASLIYKF
jgi:hypothetical protein